MLLCQAVLHWMSRIAIPSTLNPHFGLNVRSSVHYRLDELNLDEEFQAGVSIHIMRNGMSRSHLSIESMIQPDFKVYSMGTWLN